MFENDEQGVESRGTAWILLCLTVLFVFRVVAQMIQFWHPYPVLPSFEAWQSGAVPYSLLLSVQVVIVGCCLRIIWRLFKGCVVPETKMGKIWLSIGGMYFLVMCIRLILGFTVAPDHFWFGAKLPTMFHFVLAAFLLVYGRFHVTGVPPSTSIQKREHV